MAVTWVVDGNEGITIPILDAALGDGRLSHLTADPFLCERIKIEAQYASAVESQMEDAEQIRNEETLIIPEDIDYME